MKEYAGRNGGTLWGLQNGDPAHPNAGRKPNPFKQAIRAAAEADGTKIRVTGKLIVNDELTDQVVTVQIEVSTVEAVVHAMFKAAKKRDVAAARWLSETGFGKTINLANDDENPIGAGVFVVALPSNGRDIEQ